MNPMVGSGMQQARKPPVEQTVEVVRNHEGGTCVGLGSPMPKAPESKTDPSLEMSRDFGCWEWTPEVTSMEGRSLENPGGAAPQRAGQYEMRLQG
jgi:hypothetical protein